MIFVYSGIEVNNKKLIGNKEVTVEELVKGIELDINNIYNLRFPENNLHCALQVIFIRHLAKKYKDICFAISTHSYYILDAIGIYYPEVTFYLVENNKTTQYNKENAQEVYASIRRPLQILEDLEWEDDLDEDTFVFNEYRKYIKDITKILG